MSTSVPWSVKGIDPKARETAKDLARRCGMTLGEWLNQIIEDQGLDAPQASNFGSESLERLSRRIEQVEARTQAALGGLEAEVKSLSGHVCANDGGTRDDAIRSLEATLGRVAGDVYEGQQHAREAILALREDFEGFAARLAAVESGVPAPSGSGAHTVQKIGAEVLRMAEAVNLRVQAVEKRQTEAFDKVGGDVARLADQLEHRLSRADHAQATALENLGAEIARITERLSERITTSELRSAQAIDEVGASVAAIADRVSDEIGERIRQSEARTAQLLEEARGRLTRRAALAAALEAAETAAPEPADPVLAESAAPSPRLFAESEPQAATDPEPTAEILAEPESTAAEPKASFRIIKPGGWAGNFDLRTLEPDPALILAASRTPMDLDGGDLDDLEARTPFSSEEPDLLEPSIDALDLNEFDPADLDPLPDLHEQDEQDRADFDAIDALIQQAQAARAPDADSDEPRSYTGRELAEQARAAALAAGGKGGRGDQGLFSPESFARPRRRHRRENLLFFSVAAGCLALVGAGAAIVYGQQEPPMGEAQIAQAGAAPVRAASVTNPVLIDPTAERGLPNLSAGEKSPQAIPYELAAARLQAGDQAALAEVRKAADAGYAPAEYHLGKLYDKGGAGLAKNPAEARRWIERAARGGEAKAMHDLAMIFVHGQGAPRDHAAAAQWFQRAAELGLVDSQFNLAALHEQGSGVPANPAEAYKWYLVAARSGDGEAKAAATRVAARLPPETRASIERSAATAALGAVPATAQGGALAAAPPASAPRSGPRGSDDLLAAQKALARLGYYRGPEDGRFSPALQGAMQAFQRDQDLPQSAALDPATSAKLAAYVQ